MFVIIKNHKYTYIRHVATSHIPPKCSEEKEPVEDQLCITRSAVMPRFRFRLVVISTSDNYVILNSAM